MALLLHIYYNKSHTKYIEIHTYMQRKAHIPETNDKIVGMLQCALKLSVTVSKIRLDYEY